MSKPYNPICEWNYDTNIEAYETECKNTFCFIDGEIEDNSFQYCPYCGKRIFQGPVL